MSAAGCARGTLQISRAGRWWGRRARARSSSRSDDPSAPCRATVPSASRSATQSRSASTWMATGDTVLDDLGEPGDRLELVADEEAEARLGEHERGPGHARRAHRHRRRRRSAHRPTDMTTSWRRRSRGSPRAGPASGRASSGGAASADSFSSTSATPDVHGHRRRDRATLSGNAVTDRFREPRRCGGLLTRASATRVAAFDVREPPDVGHEELPGRVEVHHRVVVEDAREDVAVEHDPVAAPR